MKNELSKIINKYFSNEENCIRFCGTKERVYFFMRFFECMHSFDRPDGYAVIGNEALVFEHFEFDSSLCSRTKGSQQRKSEAYDDRRFQEAPYTDTGTVIHGEIASDYSMPNYKDNLTRIFTEHYNKIDDYIAHLTESGIIMPGIQIRTMFFAEDVTLLGNIYETDSWEQPSQAVFLPFCDFFLNMFEKCNKLNCVLCGSWAGNSYHLWFIDHSMIDEYRKNQMDTSAIQICNFTPKHIGFKISIPNPDQN